MFDDVPRGRGRAGRRRRRRCSRRQCRRHAGRTSPGGIQARSRGSRRPQPGRRRRSAAGGTARRWTRAGPALHRPPGQPRLPGRRPAVGAAHLRRDQRPEPRDRPLDSGHVDVSLRDVPWDQALDIILRANRLGYVVDGTIVRVAPLTVLADEEGQRRKLSDEQALAGELRVMTACAQLRARRGPEGAAHGHGAVAARVDPDRRAHQHDHHQRPARAARARRQPDRPRSTCRSRRSRSKRASSRPTGRSPPASACKWGISGTATPALGNTLPLAFPNTVVGRRGRQPRAVPARRPRPRAGARLDQRRVQPRRGAVGARAHGPGPHPVDAARLDAEQHRGRDHAGHPDSDSDRRQQHRHGVVPRRGADAEGDAADHGGRAR